MSAIKLAFNPRLIELQKKAASDEGLSLVESAEFMRLMKEGMDAAAVTSAKVVGETSDLLLKPLVKLGEDILQSLDSDTLSSMPGHLNVSFNRTKQADGSFKFTIETFTKRGALTGSTVMSEMVKTKANGAEVRVVEDF